MIIGHHHHMIGEMGHFVTKSFQIFVGGTGESLIPLTPPNIIEGRHHRILYSNRPRKANNNNDDDDG